MYRVMLAVGVLMLSGFVLGQSDSKIAPRQTFHVEGIIADPTGARIPYAEIRFVGENGNQTVTADAEGAYQTDLPIGAYTMTASPPRRYPMTKYSRFFRVSSPTTVTLNGTLLPVSFCDGIWVGERVSIPEGDTDNCGGGHDSFPFPSKDAVPLRLEIQYAKRGRGETLNSYSSPDWMKVPVLVTYNLLALQADTVVYNRADGTLKARGHVLIEDQSRQASADSATFKFDNGQAIRIQ
jgi:hypothetical protein